MTDELDAEGSAQNVVNLFEAWPTEFDLALRAMEKTSIAQLAPSDPVARARDWPRL
ncbi:hypothetical protein [Sulfobacillus harzensis]|uniref:Uncharacterized protein n=1 Tax=Sulfobacillus harzensis TaxID=2729629 RepID=A0A7Y0L8C2_9FIRM|nr:hypothetical protein [Sulfobacillus harzensis]NMP24656.1 hypothetical protein [Sulfobacillus harzensis]